MYSSLLRKKHGSTLEFDQDIFPRFRDKGDKKTSQRLQKEIDTGKGRQQFQDADMVHAIIESRMRTLPLFMNLDRKSLKNLAMKFVLQEYQGGEFSSFV